MRLLLTTDTIGGVWTFTKELATELLAQGHAVALISFGRTPSPTQDAWLQATSALYPATFDHVSSAAPLEWMQNNEQAYAAGLPSLLNLIDEFRPDVIHTSQFCFGNIPRPIPVVVTAHSDVLSWAAACDPSALIPSPWLDRYKSLVQTGLDAATAVTAPTRWMLEALRENFPISCPVQVILNGRTVTTSGAPHLVSETSTEPTRPLQAVTAGRLWDKAKNLTMLTNLPPWHSVAQQSNPLALAKVGEASPNSTEAPIPILIAGESHHEAASAPQHPNLTLLGPLDEPTLLDLFRQSTFYIAPSIYEPFGLAPLEAAQCGCVLLLNDLPSFREVWGDAALYFSNADQLIHTMAHILSTKNHLSTIQKRGENRAAELSAFRMAEQYLHLYSTLLEPEIDRSEINRYKEVLTHA